MWKKSCPSLKTSWKEARKQSTNNIGKLVTISKVLHCVLKLFRDAAFLLDYERNIIQGKKFCNLLFNKK